ncbi:MAG: acyl-CoA/acyl-ACP dehydrogenase [Actinomycetia bacterium]|nr:acyl-CoA/acyl-ACP dehydrogenase [Actinomycetes bacterium]
MATVKLAVESSGGFGYTRSAGLEKLFRDLQTCMFHPLPRAKQLRFTARVAQGLEPAG